MVDPFKAFAVANLKLYRLDPVVVRAPACSNTPTLPRTVYNHVYAHICLDSTMSVHLLRSKLFKIMVQPPGSWFPTIVQTLSTNQTDSRRTIQCVDLECPLIGTHKLPGLRMRMREFHWWPIFGFRILTFSVKIDCNPKTLSGSEIRNRQFHEFIRGFVYTYAVGTWMIPWSDRDCKMYSWLNRTLFMGESVNNAVRCCQCQGCSIACTHVQ